MDVTVKQAEAADWPGLALLRWQWSVDERGEEPALSMHSYVEHHVAWLSERLATHLPFVAVTADQVVGMAWLMLGDRPPTPGRLARRGGDIQSVFVVPGRRGCGLGERLVGALVEHARGLGLIHLTVHSAPGAVGFYRRLGFVNEERWLAWPQLAT